MLRLFAMNAALSAQPGALLTDASGHCQVSAGSDIFPVVFIHGVSYPLFPKRNRACSKDGAG